MERQEWLPINIFSHNPWVMGERHVVDGDGVEDRDTDDTKRFKDGAEEVGEGGMTDLGEEKSIFKTKMSLKDFKPDKNIFQAGGEEKKQAKESEFLKMSICKQKASAKDEISGVVFKATGNLHKFTDEWENIGTGTVYITVGEKKRCFFVRDGVMQTAFDFLVTYDVKAVRKKLGVCVVVRGVVEKKAVEQLYCIVFRNEDAVDEFVELIKI